MPVTGNFGHGEVREMSIDKKKQLSDRQLAVLESEMQKHRKSVGLAYVLLIFLGNIGIHQFYLGKTRRGLAYLLLGVVGWISLFSSFLGGAGGGVGGIGLLCFVVVGIFLLIDLFTLPKQVRAANETAEDKILSELLVVEDDQAKS